MVQRMRLPRLRLRIGHPLPPGPFLRARCCAKVHITAHNYGDFIVALWTTAVGRKSAAHSAAAPRFRRSMYDGRDGRWRNTLTLFRPTLAAFFRPTVADE